MSLNENDIFYNLLNENVFLKIMEYCCMPELWSLSRTSKKYYKLLNNSIYIFIRNKFRNRFSRKFN